MTTFYDKTGLPKSLAWGFIGVLIFMMGDGIEQTWLSRYIASQGLDHEVLFTVYGISVALSAWFSGVIAETIGVRRTMLLGYLVYLVGMAGFAGIGMMGLNYPVLLVTYAIKGLGYPLFAYTFIVWIAYRVDKSRLSSAQGWFWFVFTGGLNVLGAYYGAMRWSVSAWSRRCGVRSSSHRSARCWHCGSISATTGTSSSGRRGRVPARRSSGSC